MVQIHWRIPIIALLAFSFAVFSANKAIYAKDHVTIYWTDLGINQMQEGFNLGDDFMDFDQDKNRTVIVGNRSGQILVPMPSDDDLPTTDEEWELFSDRIYEELKRRTQEGLGDGAREFEIRTVQNIKTGGYLNPVRQGNVVKFTVAFAKALERLRTELDNEYTTSVQGVWASNGGYAASKALPLIARKVVDSGILVDARAWKSDVKKLYVALGGNLAIINTAGDYPARDRIGLIPLLHIDESMVARHDTACDLKNEIPGIRVLRVDSKGLDIVHFSKKHIVSIRSNSELEVEEYTGSGYLKLGNMTGEQLRKIILGNFESSKVGKSEELREELVPDPEPTKRFSNKSNIPPPFPPDGGGGGGGGGSVVGGVEIEVLPESSGKLDPRVRELVLKMRPSAEVLQRSVSTSGKEE